MICLDWKGGIGTSSRRLAGAEATVGVLVLANFGSARTLRVAGIPVGESLGGGVDPLPPPAGSCIAVVVTDLPLGTHDLSRIARRCGLGLARTGSVAHHGSGEIFLAVSTSASTGPAPAGALDEAFEGVADAAEEAVLNALWAAEDTVGRNGRVVRALPHEPVLALLGEHGLLG